MHHAKAVLLGNLRHAAIGQAKVLRRFGQRVDRALRLVVIIRSSAHPRSLSSAARPAGVIEVHPN